MKKIEAIKYSKSLCFKCLHKFDPKVIKVIEIDDLGYISYFDGCSTKLQLCETCLNLSPEAIRELKIDPACETMSHYESRYLDEDDIINYFDDLSAPGQQLVKNEMMDSRLETKMESQDWLDYYVNKTLPSDKAEEYGLSSLESIRSYQERFSTCEYPAIKVYEDSGRGCWCPLDAYGNEDQSPSVGSFLSSATAFSKNNIWIGQEKIIRRRMMSVKISDQNVIQDNEKELVRLTTRDELGRARPTQELKGYYLTQILEQLATFEEIGLRPEKIRSMITKDEMKICFSDQEFVYDSNSIFLAGPTLRDNVFEKSWRYEACKWLRENGFTGTVYVPEFSKPRHFTDEDLDAQVEWEWECLDAAGVIVFWVPRELELLPGFTTNVEFGRYLTKKPEQVILGYPKEAEKMGYLHRLYIKETDRIPASSLTETLLAAFSLLENNQCSKF